MKGKTGLLAREEKGLWKGGDQVVKVYRSPPPLPPYLYVSATNVGFVRVVGRFGLRSLLMVRLWATPGHED